MDTTDTGEPDEFARLLAQLNGTATQDRSAEPEAAAAPVVAPVAQPVVPPVAPPIAQPAVPPVAPPIAQPLVPPVSPQAPFVRPPTMAPPSAAAPTMPPPFMPAAPTPSPAFAPPSTLEPQGPPDPGVAPAFGFANPEPPRASWSPASTVSERPYPQAAPVLPTMPPAQGSTAPIAPELMGADQLAAPPAPVEAVEAVSIPTTPPPPVMAPPPVAPPPVMAPPPVTPAVPVAESPAAPPGALAPSAAPRAALDFSTVMATPVEGDGIPLTVGRPLLLGSGGADDDEPDIARSTLAEKIGLGLAVVVAPLGLIVGIVAAAGSARRRGWVIGLVRATIAIAVVLTVVWAIAGYYGYTQLRQQQLHDQTASASVAFCATIKANPTMDQLPTFGWPAVAASVPDSLKAMQAYEDRWTKLAKVSPSGIQPEVKKVAAAAKGIISSVTVSRSIDDPSNVALMSQVASSSGVPAWHAEYCR